MYEKNLSESLRLRLSKKDLDYLVFLSLSRGVSVSEALRSIILESRLKSGGVVHGDAKTDFNNKL